jgi:hypothetical protein
MYTGKCLLESEEKSMEIWLGVYGPMAAKQAVNAL